MSLIKKVLKSQFEASGKEKSKSKLRNKNLFEENVL